mmetsp:Transcript_10691/g.28348  ORF Transcript_10691/g.28348 Transcript_10691/m.28348 type:complete len:793 (-) Transcript_10691:110-2488(-)
MAMGEALERVPAGLASRFANLTGSRGAEDAELQGVLSQLSGVYLHALQEADNVTLACEDGRAASERAVKDARDGLKEVERQLTLQQDRMHRLQASADRCLADAEALRVQFLAERTRCEQSRQRQRESLSVLQHDAPLLRGLVARATGSCGPSGGSPPPLVQCLGSDGALNITFADADLRAAVARLGGAAQRAVSTHLDRSVQRRGPPQRLSITPTAGVEADIMMLMTNRSRARRGAHRKRSAHRRRHRHRHRHGHGKRDHGLAFITKGVRRERAGGPASAAAAAACSAVPPPSCEGLADCLATAAGSLEDLISEVSVQAEAEDSRCRRTLEDHEGQVKALTRQADDAGVELANAAAELSDLEALRRERRAQVRDVTAEQAQDADECVKHLADASSAMLATRALRERLRRDGAEGSFVGDCEVTGWVRGPCSVPCGAGGVQALHRSIVVAPHGARLGEEAPECPPLQLGRACNEVPCPVDSEMGRWQEWSACSRACGGGTRTRRRTVAKQAQHGGLPAGETMQEQTCNLEPCDRDCELAAWGAWAACSKACGGGHQVRTRQVLRAALGGGACPPPEDPQRQQTAGCGPQACAASPPPRCASRLDLVLALDSSGSVGAPGFHHARRFAQAVVSRLGLEDGCAQDARAASALAQVGIVDFGSLARSAQVPTSCRAALNASLEALQWQGTATNTGEALALAGELLDRHARPGARRAVAVVTDGEPVSTYIARTEAEKLRQRGVRVAVVAVGVGARGAARRLASWPPEENVVTADEYEALGEEKVAELVADLCPELS